MRTHCHALLLVAILHVFIITIGYNLPDTDCLALSGVASPGLDGTPAFFPCWSVAELTEAWSRAMLLVCPGLRAEITTDSPRYLLGRLTNPNGSDGTANAYYTARYLEGLGDTVKVLATGSFLEAGGVVKIEPPSALLAPESPILADKIKLETAEAPAGNYDLTLHVVLADGGAVVAAQSIQVTLVPITFTLEFLTNPPSYDSRRREITVQYRVNTIIPAGLSLPPTLTDLTISTSYYVTRVGGATAVSGIVGPDLGSFTRSVDSVEPTVRSFSLPCDNISDYRYHVHILCRVLDLGVEKEIVSDAVNVN